MRAAIRESDAAEYAKQKAEAARRNHAISSDDPEALTRLRQKLENLERSQERMKAINAALRIKDTEKSNAALRALGCSDSDITELRTPDFRGRIGFPAYALSNNNATIRSVKQRIAQLEAMASGPAPEGWTFDGGEVICNVEENRLQIRFDDIPDNETRGRLKANGFRWSRWGGVWQRQLTRNAIHAARSIVGQ